MMNDADLQWTVNCLINELEQLKLYVKELEEKIERKS